MKPRLLLPVSLLVGATLACASFGGLAPAGTGASVLPDPTAGLETLDNYQASLVIRFLGTRGGTPAEQHDTYEQSVWRSPEAAFTSVEGRDQNGDVLALIVGTVGEAQYVKEGDLPCFVTWGSPPETTFSPAAELWPIGQAQSEGRETVNGIPSSHYVLDNAALGLGSEVTATGDLWLAEEGGFVVKYSLTLEAGEAYFGEGSSGESQLDYEVTQVNLRPDIAYPLGCQAVYTGLPVLPDALELNRQPSITTYRAETDLAGAGTFYTEEMGALGWELDATHASDANRLGLLFSHATDGLQAVISMRGEDSVVRVIASVFGLPTASAAPGEGEPTPSGEAGATASAPVRVMGSLQALLGSDSAPSALASYHLEVRHQAPVYTGSALGQQQHTLEADIEGVHIHFTDQVVSAGGSLSTEEAYLIGKEEYLVENGAVRPGIGMARLTWAMWPMDPTAILGAGASGATLAGTETLDGRIAEVYTVEGSGTGQPGGGMGLALPVASANGQVWVDQQTGALLKAVLDYEAAVMDADGESQGTGSGHLEIEVTRVGQVVVTVPGG